MHRFEITRRDLLLGAGLAISASAVSAQEACSVFTKARAASSTPPRSRAPSSSWYSAIPIAVRSRAPSTSADKRFVQAVAEQNVRDAVRALGTHSGLLSSLATRGELSIVGACTT